MPLPAEADPVGRRIFDDLFALGRDRVLGLEHGGRRLLVRFEHGYPYAQVYVPPHAGSSAWSR